MKPMLPVLAAAALLAACGGGELPLPATEDSPTVIATPEYAPAPSILTPADDGKQYTMAVDEVSRLVVGDPHAPDPSSSGPALLIVPVFNVQESGQREWEVRAAAAGSATITGYLEPDISYAIEIQVVEP